MAHIVNDFENLLLNGTNICFQDMFKAMMPNFGSGIGMRLMQRMGWKPGTGLGREATGSLEPLMLDVKNDRKGTLIRFFLYLNGCRSCYRG